MRFLLGVLVGSLFVGVAWAQAPPDPCKAVREQLAQYAVIVANLQVALTEAQAATPKPTVPAKP